MHNTDIDVFRSRSEATGPLGGPVKRCLDIIIALSAVALLAPLLAMLVLIIKSSDQGPVFFRHRRIGRNGQPFYCLKFRTMAVDADAVLKRHIATDEAAAMEWRETKKLKNDPRVTPLGAVLRKTSVDELPQLFNVLKGEMSIVGPRPIVSDEIVKYGNKIVDYYRARPGLTGVWQISGRNDVPYEDRVRLDCDYIQNWSLGRDVAIIVRTVPVVISARGCY